MHFPLCFSLLYYKTLLRAANLYFYLSQLYCLFSFTFTFLLIVKRWRVLLCLISVVLGFKVQFHVNTLGGAL